MPIGNTFINDRLRAITLMGMSGAGKSYLSDVLRMDSWSVYSCDYYLETKYLKEDIVRCGNKDPKGIGLLNSYIGQVGSPDLGGIPLAEFKRRQNLHLEQEKRAMLDMRHSIDSLEDGQNFVHDSSGSLCELDDAALYEQIGNSTLLVYLKFDEKDHEELVRRALRYPKSLFYPPAFLDVKISEYLALKNLAAAEDVVPEEFVRWVFPALFRERLPKYQALADQYGVTIPVENIQGVQSADAFVDVVRNALIAKMSSEAAE